MGEGDPFEVLHAADMLVRDQLIGFWPSPKVCAGA